MNEPTFKIERSVQIETTSRIRRKLMARRYAGTFCEGLIEEINTSMKELVELRDKILELRDMSEGK